MLTSITPLGERGRASRWSITATAYLLGSLLGGLAVGLLAGTFGSALPLHRPGVAVAGAGVVAVGALLALLVETGRLPPPPTWRRQVDEDWLHRYRGWVYGLGYGTQLGFGLVTIVTSTSLYVVLLLAVLTGSPLLGAVVGGVFGLVRALPVLGLRRVHTTAQLTAAARRVEALAPTARRLTTATLTAVVIAATGLAVATATSTGTTTAAAVGTGART
jgi:MFS family permease